VVCNPADRPPSLPSPDTRGACPSVGLVAEFRGDLDRANAVYQEVLTKARELGVGVGVPLTHLADVALKQGRFSDAEALYEEALAHFDLIGDDMNVVFGCVALAAVRVHQGRHDMAHTPLRRGLSLMVSLRAPIGIVFALQVAALAATDARSAARLLGKADELREETGELRSPFDVSYEQAAAAAVDALGEERFDAEYAAGRALSLDYAVALALEIIDA
jgi:tetratricopeptide (TPR) repeat protein